MKNPFAIILLLTSMLALSSAVAEDIEPLDDFLQRIEAADTLPEAENWTAIADEVFTLYEDESFTDFKSRSTRTVRYTFLGDSVEQEVLSEKLEGEEMDDRGDDDGEERSGEMSLKAENLPFNPESEGDYEYSDMGMKTLAGEKMRAIAFEATVRDEEHFDGTAWFDPETARIRRIRISYADNPRAVKHFDATLGYAYVDGYRVMNLFEMDIKGRYLLVIKFNLSLRQKYHDIEILEG